jgi:argininosuccinate lyase
MVAEELGFDGVAPNSIDAVSNRDFVLDYLAPRDLRDAPLAPRRRARAVVERGVRLLRAVRRVRVGLLDHAAEEEPRRRRAAAREGAAVVAHLAALHGVMHALPLTYNKDMQEDKEHLFDAVDTLELCLSRRAGCSRGSRFDRERWRAAVRRDDRGDRRRRPARQARRAVPRGARDRRRPRARRGGQRAQRSRAQRRGARAHSEQLDASLRRALAGLLAGVEGLEGGTALARVREQLEQARALLTSEPGSRLLRAPGRRRRARPVGCVLRHGDTAGVIVETEAYHESEPACHAYVGLTPRTRVLFGPPGRAYVYRSYGIHALLNASASPRASGPRC